MIQRRASCLSKNEIWSARIAYLARHAAQFGTITGPVTTDMVKMRQAKTALIKGGSSGIELAMARLLP